VIILGHIAGIPVEETLLGLAPVGAVGVGAAWFAVRGRANRVRRLVSRVSRRRPDELVEKPAVISDFSTRRRS
jgi:hypothetical protein